MAPLYRVVSQIYEGTTRYPIVVHVFYGETPQDARALWSVHQQYDQFMRECTANGLFRGQVRCREEHFLEMLDRRGQWVAVRS